MIPVYGTPIPKHLQGCHAGSPVFVLGNGPSLREQSAAPLAAQITIGTNRIAHWMIPTYLVVQDKINFADHRESVEMAWGAGSTILLADQIHWGSGLERVYHFPTRSYSPIFVFQPDPEKGLTRGANVVLPALALAMYFGGNPVYLLGCDYTDYSTTGRPVHFIDTPTDFTRYSTNRAHYSDGYPQWNVILRGFELAKQCAEKLGVQIYNAAPEGMSQLDLFPAVKYPGECKLTPQPSPPAPGPPESSWGGMLASVRSWRRG